MNRAEPWFPSHLREISQAECLGLLAAHQVGRVAYCDDLGPVVLPVNYVLDHDTLLLEVSPHSTLATHLRSGAACFEIDEVDEFSQSGWSVLVRGTATFVENEDLPGDLVEPIAWAEGQRQFHVRVTPSQISGRRLLPA